jgi:predicted nucleic acid-binding protein
MKVLIDSSAWINFLRDGEKVHPEIAAAILNQQAHLCHPVWVELWSGARGKKDESTLMHLRSCCEWLSIDDETWNLTAELRRDARRKGLNCPLADVLIVACARRHNAELCHADKHMVALLKL